MEKNNGNADGPVRALHVLESLAAMRQPAGLLAIAAATGLSKSKAYRALRALQNDGFVDRAGRDGYRIGIRGIGLATLIGPRPALLQRARPVINRLAALSSETVTLHLRSGAHRVLVLGSDTSDWERRQAVRIGERAPLTTGCSGTVILAWLPDDEARKVIDGRPVHQQRPTAVGLARIRADGFAISRSANHRGINGVAAPLIDPADGAPLGSVVIAGPEHRLPDDTLFRLARPLMAACGELAPALATVLGPNSSVREETLNVAVQDFATP
ncbi:IclR family transcriptional regulator [Streptomyces sp. NPDC056405]|uniref:IclR family transcriptional regulator n=1 Tax=Streptomyces sp. NPDC056405 TaxID=3345811 RepID=UPI0035DCD89A